MIGGNFKVYEYNNTEKGNLLSTGKITNGHSSLSLSASIAGMSRFYLEFDYIGGGYHMLHDVLIIENSKNVTVEVSRQIEPGFVANISLEAPANSHGTIYILVDGIVSKSFSVTSGKFRATVQGLSSGSHTVLVRYNDGTNIYHKTFTVNVGIRTVIEASDVTADYYSSPVLSLNLKDSKGNALKAKEISVNLNGTKYVLTTDNNGHATLQIDLLPGNYTAEIAYAGDSNYPPSSACVNIFIKKIATSISANDIRFDYGDSTNLIVTLKDAKNNALEGKRVSVILNGKTHTLTTDKQGRATLPVDLIPGKYVAKIQFSEDNIYLGSSVSSNVVVNKLATALSAGDINIVYGDSANLIISLKDRNNAVLKGKNILINLNGKDFTVKTANGSKATLPVDLVLGKYTAKIKFNEDNIYLASSVSSDVVVNKVDTALTAGDINITYGDSANLTIAFKDAKGNSLSGKIILININDKIYSVTTDNNGEAALPIDLLPGKYASKIEFGEDEIYLSSFAGAEISVDKVDTALSANNVNMIYDDSKNLVVTLTDSKGNALLGKSVTIRLSDDVYTKKTNAKGQVVLSVDEPAGKYNARISFAGDDIYKSSGHTSKVTVSKAAPKITASAKVFKAKSKSKKLTVTLKNKNRVMKNVIVKLTVNKKTYKVKTNSKGVAVFAIKLTKKGKYNAAYKFEGNSNFKSSTKTVKISII